MSDTPRVRHMRYSQFDRLRYADKRRDFLSAEAVRTGETAPVLFEVMRVPGSAQSVLNVADVVTP